MKRVELERLRGGASLNMPEQEIEQLPDGGYRIVAAPPLPVEDWNAQISLMTGMAAAGIMLEARSGSCAPCPPGRELAGAFPPPDPRPGQAVDGEMSYGEYLRTLDPTDPQQLAIVHSAGMLFRGAGYTPFDGTLPGAAVQSAIGAAYAHSTAPLRRHGRPICPDHLRGAQQRHGCSGLGARGAPPRCRRSWRRRTSWPRSWNACRWTPSRRRC